MNPVYSDNDTSVLNRELFFSASSMFCTCIKNSKNFTKRLFRQVSLNTALFIVFLNLPQTYICCLPATAEAETKTNVGS